MHDRTPESLTDARRAWMAALLLNRRNRIMPRFFAVYARLAGWGRPWRRRLRRRAAVSLAGAALALAIGAAALPPPVAHAATITVDNGIVATGADGQCSLVEAFYNANTNTQMHPGAGECAAGAGASDVIELPANGSFTFLNFYNNHGSGPENSGVNVSSDITVQGNGSTITRDPGAPDFHLIAVLDQVNSNLFLSDVTISGGRSQHGGAIYNDSFLTLNNVTLSDNEATVAGGGLFNSGHSAGMSDSTISGNTAPDGGGVANMGDLVPGPYFSTCADATATTFNSSNSEISGNTATDGAGGGIYAFCATTNLADTTVTDNEAEDWGGGVYSDYGTTTIDASTISGNRTNHEGAGVYAGNDNTTRIYDSTLNDNILYDSGHGGAAAYSNGYLLIADSELKGNHSDSSGAAVHTDDGTLKLHRVTITGNDAGYWGGAITTYNTDVELLDSTVSDNEAAYGGGAISVWNSTLHISGSTISDNRAGDYGGGLYVEVSTATIVNSTISNNQTSDIGGGLVNDDSTVSLINSTVTGNHAESTNINFGDGGGIFQFGASASLTLERSLISGNSGISSVGEEITIYGGTATADDHNVFGHDGLLNAEAFDGFTPGGSDVTATSDGADPTPLAGILGPLADNGGPTLTHALVPGSPAVDLAPDADCTAAPVNGVDQRGAPRPVDIPGEGNDGSDTCDAGAVEGFAPETAIFMSAAASGTTGDGVAFGPHDILEWDGEEWSKWFNGTAAGLLPNGKAKHNVNSFWIPDPGAPDVVMGFAQNARFVPGISGKVDGMDLVWWDGGGFSLWFDGQDVGLTNLTGEKIDALHVLDGGLSQVGGGCLNYVLISTQAAGQVPGVGGPVRFSGEDVLGFCQTNVGPATAGVWHKLIDGSDEGMPRNSTSGLSFSDDGETMYLTTGGTFVVDSATGGHSMVYRYDFASGDFSGPHFIAAANGLGARVDGLQVEGELP